MKFLILFIFLTSVLNFSSAFFGYTNKFNTHEEPPISYSTRFGGIFAIPTQKYIEQSLDHFNPSDDRKWMMRYYENDVYFQSDGPIFIYLGGEWQISPGSITQGTLIVEMAQENNGILFYTEHRYYGLSRPTTNTSTENLQYLTIDQALADTAFFIDYIKSSSPKFKDSGVILVGASYSATMAAWMRSKYPHLVDGAFASSGPVNAQVDFPEYKEVMTRSIKTVGGDECAKIIETAFDDMELLVDQNSTSKISSSFNLCKDLQLPNDVPHFFYEVSDIVAGLIQSHRPGNIERACEYMKEQKAGGKDDVEAFGAWVIKDETECMTFSYEAYVEKFRNITWGSEANRQMRQWTYQTCAEFAWFQTSTSTDQIFGRNYPLDFFFKICNDLYDNSFSQKLIEYNVKRTNIRYAGFSPDLTNVIFTNGGLDPWHPMSVLNDLNESTPSILLPMSAHVSDLGAKNINDSPEMQESKRLVKKLVKEWLGILN